MLTRVTSLDKQLFDFTLFPQNPPKGCVQQCTLRSINSPCAPNISEVFVIKSERVDQL